MSENLFAESLYTEDLYLIPARPKIVITTPWSELSKEEKDQLTKITEAIRQRINPKLGLSAFEVNSVQSLALSTWKPRPEKLIYFGEPVKGLNFYEVVSVGDAKMVLSDTLQHLIADELSRTKLWRALQEFFA